MAVILLYMYFDYKFIIYIKQWMLKQYNAVDLINKNINIYNECNKIEMRKMIRWIFWNRLNITASYLSYRSFIFSRSLKWEKYCIILDWSSEYLVTVKKINVVSLSQYRVQFIKFPSDVFIKGMFERWTEAAVEVQWWVDFLVVVHVRSNSNPV